MKFIGFFLLCLLSLQSFSQAYNPQTGSIDWNPNSGAGLPVGTFNCGQTITGRARVSLSGPANTNYTPCVPASNPLIIDFALSNGALFIGSTANDAVTAQAPGVLWEGYFNWTYPNGATKNLIRATQKVGAPGLIPLDGDGVVSTQFDFSVQLPLSLGTFSLKSTITAPLEDVTCLNVDEAPINLNNTGGDSESTNNTLWCRTLPIESIALQSLNKEVQGIGLVWKTINESNTNKFEIERLSDVKKNIWVGVGSLAAAGTTTQELTYQFLDKTSTAVDKIYYRIKQIDHDGTYIYSDIRGIQPDRSKLALAIEGYPNPTKGLYNIRVVSKIEETMNVEIFDILGKIIATQKISVRAGSNLHSIPMDRLNTGTYVVKISGSEVSDMLTVMKVD